MRRRRFILASGTISMSFAAMAGAKESLAQTIPGCSTPESSIPASGINVLEEIKALRIPTGPYAGAYEIAPNGRLNWYFSNLGLISIIQYLDGPALDKYIRVYLDLYLSKLEANFSIQDVDFPFGRANTENFKRVLSDSDDSYAGTFLSLVTRYLRASQNWAWWDKNKSKIKDLTYRNIAVSSKLNGLTCVFQSPRSQNNNAGYLMDNAEVYRGLKDLTSILKARADLADAAYYDQFAKNIANAMAGLFSVPTSGFRMSDLTPATETSFYPGTTCQVFPQIFGVTELAGRYDQAWNFFNINSKGWESGSLDPYPWALLGLAAAKRGQYALARAQLTSIEKKFESNRAMITINELGFYQRTKSILAGRQDV